MERDSDKNRDQGERSVRDRSPIRSLRKGGESDERS